MKAVIKRSKIKDLTFQAPPSKSYTHRAYAVAALAEGDSTIRNPLKAGDTDSTLSACRALGVNVDVGADHVVIHGTGGRLSLDTGEGVIDVGNSGTTIRFFTSISALNGRVTLTGDSSIQRRPMQPLLDALGELGVKALSKKGNGSPPIEVMGGGIEGGKAAIRGDVSSQFISSLLIAAPYAKNEVEIEITSPLISRPYVDVTLDVMQTFGAAIKNEGYQRFIVKQGVYKPREYTVTGDFSSASYLLSLAAIFRTGVVGLNLSKGSPQGDKIILSILEKMGASVKWGADSITVEGKKLESIDVDLRDTPDLLPTVAALACVAEGRSVIRGIGHARIKECDRVAASAEEFAKFGVEIEEGRDFLVIDGRDRLKGGKVNSHGDHRMVMALSLLGLYAKGETVIDRAESVDISFPGFFDLLREAGGEVTFK